MWILDQTKYEVVNVNNYDSIVNLRGPIRVISGSSIENLGSYDQEERAAQVFEELLTSLANGDNLFRMPEK